MTARVLDGQAISKDLRSDLALRVDRLTRIGVRPGLAVIIIGDDPASQVYVRNKVNACIKAGIYSEKIAYPESVATDLLLAKIHDLNLDQRIHGILVQLPLPKHIDESRILSAISPNKDVDGFHAENVGALSQGNPRFIPCTPYGVMKILERTNISLAGKEAVIVGRSNIVGKPMAQLLLSQSATVTICHSRTADLKNHTRRADILIAAVGKSRMISGDMIKPGAIVIDVGINRLPEADGGKLCGDVDFGSCKEIAGYITPVPGGVGPMTITMLLTNTVESAERLQSRD